MTKLAHKPGSKHGFCSTSLRPFLQRLERLAGLNTTFCPLSYKEEEFLTMPWIQCDQIGQNLDIRATLGYFIPNNFSQTQAVSRDGLL
jgi:hypothetical protein